MGLIQNIGDVVQDYVLGVIRGKNKGKLAPAVRIVLRGLSGIFAIAVQFRLYLYRSQILRTKSLGCMIISIGNITVGGTGKTPAVEIFARALLREGRKVAVISRGYRSSSRFRLKRFIKKLFLFYGKDKQVKVVSDGSKIYLNSSLAGDEPYMLAKNIEGVVVAVDKDRVKAGEYVIQKYGIDTIILDDGFQYLSLNPRFDVLLIDTTNPFGNMNLLPAGILREPIENIRRANLIMLTKSQPGKDLSELKSLIRQYNYNADFIECQHVPIEFVNLIDGSPKELQFIKGKKTAMVSGIADPEGFEKMLQDLGANIVISERFQDHHRFSVREIREILKECTRKNVTALITTQKDAVRFPALSSTRGIPIYYLKVDMNIINGIQDFHNCISQLCFR